MLTFLQIVIVLLLIALGAIIIGYLFGKLACKQSERAVYVEKGKICEEEYLAKMGSEGDLKKNSEHLKSVATLEEKENITKSNIEEKNENIDKEIEQEKSISSQIIKEDSANKEEKSDEKNIAKEIEVKDENLLEDKKVNQKEEENNANIEEKIDNQTIKAGTKEQEENLNEEIKSQLKTQENKDGVADEQSSKKEENSSLKSDTASILPPQKTGLIEGKEPDNLTLIKGVGTVIAQKLNELGIYYFEQIAAWEEDDIVKIDQYLAFKGRIKREEWVEQAKDLAKGIEGEFAKRVKDGKVPSSNAS